MKLAAIAISATALLVAGSAAASDRISDAEYLKAARCKGLASSVTGVVDAQSIAAFLKTASLQRSNFVMDRADQETDKGKRDGKVGDKTRVTAELTGACQAYLGDPSSMAKR